MASTPTIEELQRQLAAAIAERDEARAQQAATAEVLGIINASRGNLEPVFGAMLEKAMHLCEAAFGIFGRFDGRLFEPVVDRGVPPELIATTRQIQSPPPNSGLGRLAAGESVVQLVDLVNTDIYRAGFVGATALVDIGGARTAIFVALRKDGILLGVIVMYRREVRAFSDKQVALLQNFAAQAVIAMENARLLTEQREALEQQTATADILRVISQSPTDVRPVLDAVVKAAVRFCGAEDAVIALRDGDRWAGVAHEGPMGGPTGKWLPLDRESAPGRSMVDRQTVQFPDIEALDPVEHAAELTYGRRMGIRAVASAPMLRDQMAIGAVALRRGKPGAFSAHQIGLLESFAAQAVIAIENVRLFTELRESLDQQTATADILRVISQSPTDVQPVLAAVAASARRFCGADNANIHMRDGDELVTSASASDSRARGYLGALIGNRIPIDRRSAAGRAVLESRTVHLPNVMALDPVEYGKSQELAGGGGFHTVLCAPMLRDGKAIGVITLPKVSPEPFTPRQIMLLEAFAAQAVIAIENVRLFTELREALDQQTATADILRVISQSPTDVQPVLNVVVKAAQRFCGADDVVVSLRDGDELTIAAHDGPIAAPPPRRKLDRSSAQGRAVIDTTTVHLPDIGLVDPQEWSALTALAQRAGAKAFLAAPMLREGTAIGAILLRRRTPGAFTERQSVMLEAFAAQAVIALENTRLFTELQKRTDDLTESLDQQTATADILRVIAESPTDVAPVLEAVAQAALRFCGAGDVAIDLREGDIWRCVAHAGILKSPVGMTNAIGRKDLPGRTMLDRAVTEIPDIEATTGPETAFDREVARQVGFRAALSAPLLRAEDSAGAIILHRTTPGAFSERQIALLESFAAQAVIALENTRLFTELQKRTDDLTESLDYQTATSEVLAVISRSPADLQPVLEAMTAAAVRLCGVKTGGLSVRRGDTLQFVALVGQMPEFERWQRSAPLPIERGILIADAVLDKEPVQVVDVMETDAYKAGAEVERAVVELGGHRTILHVPLIRDDEAVGVLTVSRSEPQAFTERQIGLIKTFADQAVIAMENARLLSELRERTHDLTESLDYQTATSELLEVISRSDTDVQPVFDTMLASAARLCGVEKGDVAILQGDAYRHVAFIGCDPDELAWLRTRVTVPGRGTSTARALLERRTDHVLDQSRDPERVAPKEATRERTTLAVPLLRNGEPLGVISLLRDHVEPFTERQIALIETFADQAVIAMENARLLSELRESLDQQTATAEILQVINTSPGDLTPVFRAILEKAHSSCGADMGSLFSWDGTHLCAAVTMGYSPEIDEILRTPQAPPAWVGDLVSGKLRFFHRTFDRERTQQEAQPFGPRFAAGSGIRTNLIIPLRKDDAVLGFISANRRDVRPYSDKEISLLENFAAQAVIAMENARLLNEVRQRETELAVTFEHMGDGVAMFDAGLKLASWNRHFQELLDIPDSFLATRPGLEDYVRLLVQRGELGHDNPDEEIARYRDRASETWVTERMRPDGRILEVRNNPVPGGGSVLIYSDVTERKKAEAEIAAARDAAEAALERQTATADILKVIASSPSDTQPAFDAIAESANRLLAGLTTAVWRLDGETAHLAAFTSVNEEADQALKSISPLRFSDFPALALLEAGQTVQHVDLDSMLPALRELALKRGFRSQLLVPLIAQRSTTGFVSVTRAAAGRFNEEDVQLLQTFADQAVIAIENARLFNDLRESLEQQTATSEILQVIASSPTDVQPVLDVVVKAAVRFCGATDVNIHMRDGNDAVLAAHEGPLPATLGDRITLSQGTAFRAAIVDGVTVHRPDILALDPVEFANAHRLAREYGLRAVLMVPLLREGTAVGAISLRRVEPGAFTRQQIELLETFAAQAVIAIENVRLFTELRDSLERLKAAQANLVQSEKMASLGQLTAGIAHEIKNPLNFVNNFATLSVDLLDELKEVAGPALATLDEDKRAEVDETIELLTGNLGKIAEHGKRADGIVKSMLSHSRGGAGDWAPADINALVEEALNLAYHGARSQDKEFNVTLERDLGKTDAPIEVVPQDVTRVFLNLFGNGFYAANKRRMAGRQPGFRPTLTVTTRDLGDRVEVKVRDNGIGMTPEVKEKLFQPFFTTKPTGEGTGLGLSISYDIVTQQHGGTIEVESEPDNYTEFTVRLPRARRVAEAKRGS